MLRKFENHMDIDIVEAVGSAREHTNSVDALKIDPSNNKRFATGSHDRTIKIWDTTKLKCVSTSQADR